MDQTFFPDDLLYGDVLEAADPFIGLSCDPSSNPDQAEADHDTSQLARVPGLWDGSLGLDDVDANGLQVNVLQPDGGFHPSFFSLQDPIYNKSYASGHALQAPYPGGFLAVPNANDARPRGANSFLGCPYRYNLGNTIPAESGRSAIDRNSSIYGHGDFMLDVPQFPPFDTDFRGNNDVSIQPPPFSGQFTSADLGMPSQYTNADETVSVACSSACNSGCISSVCEDENCSATGVPCDDPACVEDNSPAEMLSLTQQTPHQMASRLGPFHQTHSQSCNHTESEHQVARTLGELRAPSELGPQVKTPYNTNFESEMVSCAGEQFYDNNHHSYSSIQFPAEVEKSISNNPPPSLQPIPSLAITPPEQHVCQWIMNPNAPQSEIITCGAEFTDTEKFHQHLCKSHIDKMTTQAGFACLWAGCSRKQDRPFVTRGKLRRHIATHSAYKPFTCDVCHQGFSGSQALQQHQRIHTGDKPYKCTAPGCHMAFKQKSALTMHSRTHTGEKPLMCDVCGKRFPESSNLSKHKKIHEDKSDKFTCDEIVKGNVCGRSFRRLDQLRRHRQTHLNLGRRRAGHNRSMSAVSIASGEVLDSHRSTPSI
ncbi:hypothetical protein F4678DRAFT_428395 [Xylaria arbuscula]|nr:hypothetical protein F4678DRAFT_428395 [Xylaria arbuscula]